MLNARLKGVLAAVLAASTLASCGESILDAAEQRDRRGEGREKVIAQQRARGDHVAKQPVKDKPAGEQRGRTEPADRGDATSGRTGAVTSPIEEQGSAPAEPKQEQRPTKPAVSCAPDMAGDMESAGSPPSYADLQNGCLREEGAQLALAASTVGALPARMPDRNTHVAIAFAIERPSGPTIYVTAESTDGGWTATLSEGRQQRSLPAPVVSGKQLTMVVPADVLGGASRVEWHYESSWLRSTLTSTHYAFDDAPNGGGAAFFESG